MRTSGIAIVLVATVFAVPTAWAQRGGPGGGGFDGGGLMLLSQKSVQDELNLTEDQIKKLEAPFEKQRESFGELRDLSREERQKRMAEVREQAQKAVSAILDEGQQKRLRQIALQVQGGQALTTSKVASALGLTDEQKEKIEEIQTSARDEMRGLFQGAADGDREAVRMKFAEVRKATGKKLQGVLTAEQQARWKEMTGEPFTGELRGQGGRGQGPRGRRSRGGAAIPPAGQTLSVLTADRENEDAEETADSEGPPRSTREKKQGKKHASRHYKSPSAHARHPRGTRGHHAVRSLDGQFRHRPNVTGHRRDAHSEAWGKVARAMGHEHGQRSFSYHGQHRSRGNFVRKSFRHHRSFGPSQHTRHGIAWGHGHHGRAHGLAAHDNHRRHCGFGRPGHGGPNHRFAGRHPNQRHGRSHFAYHRSQGRGQYGHGLHGNWHRNWSHAQGHSQFASQFRRAGLHWGHDGAGPHHALGMAHFRGPEASHGRSREETAFPPRGGRSMMPGAQRPGWDQMPMAGFKRDGGPRHGRNNGFHPGSDGPQHRRHDIGKMHHRHRKHDTEGSRADQRDAGESKANKSEEEKD